MFVFVIMGLNEKGECLMREIKFRVWDKKNKRWLSSEDDYIYHLSLSGNLIILDYYDYGKEGLHEHSITRNEADYEIAQLTGLLDKNGVEIYEGDIVTTQADSDIPYEIFWSDELACFMVAHKGNRRMSTLLPESDDCKVIGNIYEDKSLLNK